MHGRLPSMQQWLVESDEARPAATTSVFMPALRGLQLQALYDSMPPRGHPIFQ